MSRWWIGVLLILICGITSGYADRLIVSNYPEELYEPGRLVSSPLDQGLTRLMYYHINRSSEAFILSTQLTNPNPYPVTIQWRHGMGGPSEDGIYAGHRSARLYWEKHVANQWTHLVLQAGESIQLLSQPLRHNMVSTALLEFQTNQSNVTLTIDALDPPFLLASSLHQPSQPYRFGSFDSASQQHQLIVDFKTPIQEIALGGNQFLYDPQSQILLRGNYGMIYEITALLKNPTAAHQTVALYLAPLGGITRGVLVIDDRIIETSFISYKTQLAPELVQSFSLKPHESRRVLIKTLPQGGCYYPVNLVFAAHLAGGGAAL